MSLLSVPFITSSCAVPGFVLVTICVVLCGCVVVRRMLFHPLRRFPGPKLAKATSLYKTYFEIIRQGDFLKQLHYLHEVYGSVVRIGPNELHFSDPDAYAEIYASRSTLIKDAAFYKCFGVSSSTFGAINHEDVKRRKELLSPLFSRRAILNLEGLVQAKVDHLISRLSRSSVTKPADMFMAFRSVSMDIITAYSFSHCVNALDVEDFMHPLLVTIQTTVSSFWIVKLFPFLIPVIQVIPGWVAARLHHQFHAFLRLRLDVGSEIDKFADQEIMFEESESPTIYHQLLAPKLRCGSVISKQYLLDEALSLVQAGSDTVGNACTVGTFFILHDPVTRSQLVNELDNAFPDEASPMSFPALEKLPYLTAVIKESMRFAHGFVTPLPRIVHGSQAIVRGNVVPAGTIISSGITFLHNSPDIFRNPSTFSPERWLGPDARHLENYLVPFSSGPRMCLGINLAWCELYMIFGNIFRRLNMEIYDTSVEDMTQFKDFFIPVYSGKHFRAVVEKRPE